MSNLHSNGKRPGKFIKVMATVSIAPESEIVQRTSPTGRGWMTFYAVTDHAEPRVVFSVFFANDRETKRPYRSLVWNTRKLPDYPHGVLVDSLLGTLEQAPTRTNILLQENLSAVVFPLRSSDTEAEETTDTEAELLQPAAKRELCHAPIEDYQFARFDWQLPEGIAGLSFQVNDEVKGESQLEFTMMLEAPFRFSDSSLHWVLENHHSHELRLPEKVDYDDLQRFLNEDWKHGYQAVR